MLTEKDSKDYWDMVWSQERPYRRKEKCINGGCLKAPDQNGYACIEHFMTLGWRVKRAIVSGSQYERMNAASAAQRFWRRHKDVVWTPPKKKIRPKMPPRPVLRSHNDCHRHGYLELIRDCPAESRSFQQSPSYLAIKCTCPSKKEVDAHKSAVEAWLDYCRLFTRKKFK